jgi:branched-chain amino acid transport system permease protein
VTAQVIVNGLITGSIYVIAALGFNLIYGTTGTFHIAYGSSVLVAVYIATVVGVSGTSGYVGLFAGLAVAAVVGVVVYQLFYLPLERRGRSRTIVFVASLGLTTLLGALIPWIFNPQPRNFELPWLLNARHILGLAISPLNIIALFGAATLAFGLWALLQWTAYGRSLRGIAVNPELGEIMGLRRAVIITIAFAAGSALGFIALSMQAMSSAVTPDIGVSFTLIAAITVLAGGMGSLTGSYAIAILFGLVQAIAEHYLPARWSVVLVYVVFTLIILWRPTGLFRGFSRSAA